MSYTIHFENVYGVKGFPIKQVRTAIQWVLERHGVPPASELTLVVTDDQTVRNQNKYFRGVDAPTDILSFPSEPLPEELATALGEPPYLGDLIVAYPYTVQQAEEAGHTLADELTLIAIHGTLHLLGFDHDNAPNQDKMWAAQAEALAAAGVAISVPKFTFNDRTGNSADGKTSEGG